MEQISIGLPESFATPGSSVTILCNAAGLPPPLVIWDKNGVPLTPGGNYQLSGNVLTINMFSRDDVASYSCTATNTEGQDRETIAVKMVTPPRIDRPRAVEEPPKDSTPSTTLTVSVGEPVDVFPDQTATITCTASGDPPPKIEWILPSSSVVEEGDTLDRFSVSGGALTIRNARENDEGNYQCRATNDGGQATATSSVNVREYLPNVPSTIEVEVNDRTVVPTASNTVTLYEESRLLLNCTFATDSPASIRWLKDGVLVQSNSERRLVKFSSTNSYGLRIASAAGSDAGKYSCVLDDGFSKTSESVNIIVQSLQAPLIDRSPPDAPPQMTSPTSTTVSIGVTEVTVVPGNDVTITCTASGTPNPTISWQSSDGTNVPSDSSGSLTLRDVTAAEAMAYTCEAVNSRGRDEETIIVTLAEPPQIQRSEVVVTETPIPDEDRKYNVGQTSRVQNGRTVRIMCMASGRPDAEIRWRATSTGVQLRVGETSGRTSVLEDGTLQIVQVSTSDEGDYVCTAENTAGMDEETSEVTVLVPLQLNRTPTVVDGSPSTPSVDGSVTVVENSRVTQRCNVSGRPSPTLAWTRNGVRLQNTARTVINTVSSGDGLTVTSDLTLFPALRNDSGSYSCVAQNEVESASNTQEIVVIPQEAPLIDRRTGTTDDGNTVRTSVGQPDVYVTERRTVIVECTASGVPLPTTNWFLGDSGILVPSDGPVRRLASGALQIDTFQGVYAGKYTCQAENPVGLDRETIDVRLAEKPVPVIDPEVAPPTRGGTAVYGCQGMGSPTPKVEWVLPSGETLSPGESTSDGRVRVDASGSLEVVNLMPSDEGTYICTLTNDGGKVNISTDVTAYERPFITRVSVNALVVNAGDEIEPDDGSTTLLICFASGNPIPDVNWYKDGLLIDREDDDIGSSSVMLIPKFEITRGPGSALLTISDYTTEDAGVYSCGASNPAGNADFSLIFKEPTPPTITPPRTARPMTEAPTTEAPTTVQAPTTAQAPVTATIETPTTAGISFLLYC